MRKKAAKFCKIFEKHLLFLKNTWCFTMSERTTKYGYNYFKNSIFLLKILIVCGPKNSIKKW